MSAHLTQEEWDLQESQIRALQAELDAVEADVTADQGEDAWEAGGWYVIKDQIRYSSYPDAVKREVARMNGIDRDLIGLADPDNEDHW